MDMEIYIYIYGLEYKYFLALPTGGPRSQDTAGVMNTPGPNSLFLHTIFL